MTRVTVTIEVPDPLRDLAVAQGKTVEDLARQALARWIEETLEDEQEEREATEALRRIESGEDRTYTHEEVWEGLDAVPGRVQP